ncbi:unnamed protein product [Pedinophyceae sp. YPF-701]|nr:unnamed protein product [Pedinophyceae sp. YPF-701]
MEDAMESATKKASAEAPQSEAAAPSPSLADVLQVERLFDFVPPSTAVELAATCWDGLVAVLRYGCGYEGVTDWWAHDGYDRWSDGSKHRAAVRRILPGGAMVRGLAGRMEGVSRCVGRLEVAGAHFPAEDARAMSEAADAAGMVPQRPLSTCRVASDGPDEQVGALAGMVRAGSDRLRVVKVCVSSRDRPGSLFFAKPGGLFNVDLFLGVLGAPAVCDHVETFSVVDVAAVGGDIEGMLAVLRHTRALETLSLKNEPCSPDEMSCMIPEDIRQGARLGQVVAKLIRSCAPLREIELSHLGISSFGAAIARAIAARTGGGGGVLETLRVGPGTSDSEFATTMQDIDLGSLSTLDLRLMRLRGPALHRIAPQLVNTAANNLVALHLEATNLDTSSARAFGSILRGCTALRRLSLAHFDAWATFMAVLTSGAQLPLEVLRVREHKRDNEALEVAAELVARSKALLELDLAVEPVSEEYECVYRVVTRREEPVLALAAAIRRSTRLRRLAIDYENRYAATFARAVANNKSLKEVALTRGFLSDDEDENDDWDPPVVFDKVLSRNSGLEKFTVVVARCEIRDQVLRGLEGNNTLRALEIEGSYLYPSTSPWAAQLSEVLRRNTSLKSLVLKDMIETPEGKDLGRMLARNKGLEVLRVESRICDGAVCFNDEDAQSFADGLRANRTLRRLRVAGALTAGGLRALRDGLKGRPGAFELELDLTASPDADAIRELRGTGARVVINVVHDRDARDSE